MQLIRHTYATQLSTEGRNVRGLAAPVYDGSPGTEANRNGTYHRFAAGAFDFSLKEFQDIKVLFGHDATKVISRAPTAQFWADSSGLHFDAPLNGTSWANDTLALLAENPPQLNGISVGVYALETKKVRDGQKDVVLMTKVALEEVSLVYDPAFQSTTIQQYSENDLEHYKKRLQAILDTL